MPRACGGSNCYPAKRRRVLPRQAPSVTAGATSDSGTSTTQPTGISSNDSGAVVRFSGFGCNTLMSSPSVSCCSPRLRLRERPLPPQLARPADRFHRTLVLTEPTHSRAAMPPQAALHYLPRYHLRPLIVLLPPNRRHLRAYSIPLWFDFVFDHRSLQDQSPHNDNTTFIHIHHNIVNVNV